LYENLTLYFSVASENKKRKASKSEQPMSSQKAPWY